MRRIKLGGNLQCTLVVCHRLISLAILVGAQSLVKLLERRSREVLAVFLEVNYVGVASANTFLDTSIGVRTWPQCYLQHGSRRYERIDGRELINRKERVILDQDVVG